HRPAAESLGTEVGMLGRFVGDPEVGSSYRELRYHRTVRGIDPEQLRGPECGLVEVHRLGALADREHGGDSGFLSIGVLHGWMITKLRCRSAGHITNGLPPSDARQTWALGGPGGGAPA